MCAAYLLYNDLLLSGTLDFALRLSMLSGILLVLTAAEMIGTSSTEPTSVCSLACLSVRIGRVARL